MTKTGRYGMSDVTASVRVRTLPNMQHAFGPEWLRVQYFGHMHFTPPIHQLAVITNIRGVRRAVTDSEVTFMGAGL